MSAQRGRDPGLAGMKAVRARTYLVGFSLSLLLTVAAYVLAVGHVGPAYAVVASLVGLAVVQFGVQLWTFLHVGIRPPRWKLYAVGLMVVVVTILLTGLLWIMANLDSRTGMDDQVRYMNSQGGP